MEITPRYAGYWTQVVRTMAVGTPNPTQARMHEVAVAAIKKGAEKVRPGGRVMDIVLAMESYVVSAGFEVRPPCGHLCGLDMIDGRVSRENETIMKPWTAVIIHPFIFTADGTSCFFWGETYLVTEDGGERLHRAGDELRTIG
jgi:Xaa-Pro aminopeptidase